MDEKMRIEHAGHVTTKPWPTQFDNDPSKLFELTGKIPKREWFGLTAKDLAEIPPSCYEGAIWADAKLQEKNARLLRDRLAQPEKVWVGLTEEERAKCWTTSAVQTAINIEAKLKEKNT